MMDSPDIGIFVPVDTEISSNIGSESSNSPKSNTNTKPSSNTTITAIPSPKRRMQNSRNSLDVEKAPVLPSTRGSPLRREYPIVHPDKTIMPVTPRSPARRDSTPETKSRSVENSPVPVPAQANASHRRWRRDFLKCNRPEKYLKKSPQDYARSTSRSKGDYKLLPIDEKEGRAGYGRCRDATVVQWATIISQAKATRPLAPEFKEVVYQICDQELNADELKPGDIADRTSYAEKLPLSGLPLSRRVQTIQKHLVRRALRLRQAKEENQGSLSTRSSPSQAGFSSSDNVTATKDGNRMPSSQNIFLSAISAEENANDYEFRKGVGRVQINQLHLPEVPLPEGPYRLSPSSYAYKDLNFEIFEMFTVGEHFKSTEIDIWTLAMKGETDQSFKILLGDELRLNIPFRDIKFFIYGRKTELLIRYFADSLSGDESCPRNLVDVLLNIECRCQGSWAILKQCCYKIVQNWEPKQRCDQATEEDFFVKKQEELMSKSLRKTPFPQTANRGALNPKPWNYATQKKQPVVVQSIIAFQSAAVQSTIAFQPPVIAKEPKIGEEPKSRKVPPVDGELLSGSARSERITKRLSESSGIENIQIEGLQSEQRAKKARIEAEEKNSRPSGLSSKHLYYQTKSDSETCIRVGVNDPVVRLRSEEDKKRNGKKDKFDLFDGPWRIAKLNSPRLTYGVNHGKEDIASTRSDYETSEWNKMLTTKVKLNFPEGSHADRWVEIGNLLPVLEETDDNDSLSVVELKAGVKVPVNEVEGQRLFKSDKYEVEKLRDKRIRLYKLSSPAIKKFQMKQDDNDSWIKRLKFHHREITMGHLLVTEYRVHWAGWPDEDDTWSIGFGNVPQEFIDYFNEHTDCYRELGIEVSIQKEDLVCQEDLVGLKNRKVPAPKSQISGRNTTLSKMYFNSEAKESKTEKKKECEKDESSGEESDVDDETARAIQASIDDESQRKKSMNLQNFRSFQRKIGVPAKEISEVTEYKEEDEEYNMQIDEEAATDREEGNIEIDEEAVTDREDNMEIEGYGEAATDSEEESQETNED